GVPGGIQQPGFVPQHVAVVWVQHRPVLRSGNAQERGGSGARQLGQRYRCGLLDTVLRLGWTVVLARVAAAAPTAWRHASGVACLGQYALADLASSGSAAEQRNSGSRVHDGE